jgi:hypothetical protein
MNTVSLIHMEYRGAQFFFCGGIGLLPPRMHIRQRPDG